MDKVTSIKPQAQRAKSGPAVPPAPDFASDRDVGAQEPPIKRARPNYYDKLFVEHLSGTSSEIDQKPWADDFKKLNRFTYMLDALATQILSSHCEQDRFDDCDAGSDEEWASCPTSPDGMMGLQACQQFIANEMRTLVQDLALRITD